jgi:hypothetical protein
MNKIHKLWLDTKAHGMSSPSDRGPAVPVGVHSVHPPDELLPAAYALAAEIIENTAPVSAALNRQLMWQMLGAAHPMQAHIVDSRVMLERGRAAPTSARASLPSWTSVQSSDASSEDGVVAVGTSSNVRAKSDSTPTVVILIPLWVDPD